jgi:cytochrome c oxidase subunit II
MTSLIVLLCVLLSIIVVVQLARVTELASVIKGPMAVLKDSSYWNGRMWLVFLVLFIVGTVWSSYHYKNVMLGFGPLQSASEHGSIIDDAFTMTLFFTGIVFVLTHIALCWFAYKYAFKEGAKAKFFVHDTKLEVIWTAIPAVVMTLLVVQGLNAWNKIMADIKPDEEYIEIEAMGQQFGWLLRYPGADGKIGSRDFKMTSGTNPVGQDWADSKNADDFHPDEVVLPVGKKVRVRILAKDVLHNFYLPHFRVKMDAIPGLPTYFVFTPVKTTSEFRSELAKYPEWNLPFDKTEPNGGKRWEKFEYELACAELCGKGHYSMRKRVRIVTQEEYDAWEKTQKSYYLSNIRNTKEDPFAGQILEAEARAYAPELESKMAAGVVSADAAAKLLQLPYVQYETGSAALKNESKYMLDILTDLLKKSPDVRIELGGHTDNMGVAAANMSLSSSRALAVTNYLVSKGIAANRLTSAGFGDTKPLVANDTDENRAQNRRTEVRILNQPLPVN